MVTTTSSLPSGTKARLDAIYGTEFKLSQSLSDEFYTKETKHKNWIETMQLSTFGTAYARNEGEKVKFIDERELFPTRVYMRNFGAAYAITDEAVSRAEPLEREKIILAKAQRLVHAMKRMQDIEGHYLFNNANNTNSIGGDGQNYASLSHQLEVGTYQNAPTVAFDFNDAGIRDLLILIAKAVDNAGQPIDLSGRMLVTHVDSMFELDVIFNSTLKSGTAENDKNALGSVQMDKKVSKRYTVSPTSFFILTGGSGVEKALVRYIDSEGKTEMSRNAESRKTYYSATEAYCHMYNDARTAFFSGI